MAFAVARVVPGRRRARYGDPPIDRFLRRSIRERMFPRREALIRVAGDCRIATRRSFSHSVGEGSKFTLMRTTSTTGQCVTMMHDLASMPIRSLRSMPRSMRLSLVAVDRAMEAGERLKDLGRPVTSRHIRTSEPRSIFCAVTACWRTCNTTRPRRR